MLRKAVLGGSTLVAASALVARPSDAVAQDGGGDFVPRTGPLARGEFVPVFTRTAPDRPPGSHLGFYTGAGVFNDTVDPFVALGYFGGSGEWTSAWQLEGDWDSTPGGGPHITELYWQILKPDGSSRRPFYMQYDRDLGRSTATWFMIGNGQEDNGKRPGSFSVNWDNDSSQVGVNLFTVKPNRIKLFAVVDGGVDATETRLCLYSAPNKGSAISLTFDGQDAEGVAHPTFLIRAQGPTYSDIWIKGQRVGYFAKPSNTKAGLALLGGIQLGDNSHSLRSSLWSSSGAPDATLGNNGDWCMSDNGNLYFKAAGAWTPKGV